jgi:hypothetical protein
MGIAQGRYTRQCGMELRISHLKGHYTTHFIHNDKANPCCIPSAGWLWEARVHCPGGGVARGFGVYCGREPCFGRVFPALEAVI